MSDTNTNNPSLPDFDSFFKNQGKPIGYDPTDAEMDLARAVLVPVTKELMMRQFAQPTNIQSAGTLTNEATGDVYAVAKDGAGRISQFIKPEVIQTTGGFEYISGPGQTRPFINRETGEQPKGYAASGNFYGMGQPVVGGDNSAARAAAAAATGASPAPTPAPQPYAMTNAEGASMSFNNPYDVRAAFKGGSLTQEEARRALSHFGIK
jgi:hypothetical protein